MADAPETPGAVHSRRPPPPHAVAPQPCRAPIRERELAEGTATLSHCSFTSTVVVGACAPSLHLLPPCHRRQPPLPHHHPALPVRRGVAPRRAIRRYTWRPDATVRWRPEVRPPFELTAPPRESSLFFHIRPSALPLACPTHPSCIHLGIHHRKHPVLRERKEIWWRLLEDDLALLRPFVHTTAQLCYY